MRAHLAGLKLGPRRGSLHSYVGGGEDVSRSGDVSVVVCELILWGANVRSLVKGQLAAQNRNEADVLRGGETDRHIYSEIRSIVILLIQRQSHRHQEGGEKI